MKLSGFLLRPWICLAALALVVPMPAQTPLAPSAKHRQLWRLTPFTYVKLVPREAGAPANDQPVALPNDFLVASLAAIRFTAPDGEDTLFIRDEIAVFREKLREAFAVAGPDEDLLLVSSYRHAGGALNPPKASTSRLFWQGNTLQIIVHDTQLDFWDAYYANQVMPEFSFGSRAAAGEARIKAAGATSRRADWLSFPLQPVAAPVLAAAPVATAPAAPAAPAPARDAAFFAEREQRLRGIRHLRDENLITEEEYQKKRADIINGL